MKNKGFTLVEVLGVLVIISLLSIIIIPSVNSIINKSKQTVADSQYKKIIEAAYNLSIENPSKYFNDDSYITLAELKSKGYFENDIILASTGESISDDLTVVITQTSGNYSNYVKYGKYIYYIKEKDELNAPSISLGGVAFSNGIYSSTLDINDTYTPPTLVYDTSNYKLYTNITKDGAFVSSVDTSVITIYKVTYTIIDSSGNSNSAIYKVVIKDDDPPTLTFNPETLTISLWDNLDLMSGVTCTDNSGSCDITTTGTVNIGIAGDYIVTYTAKDSSGNTTTQNRTISVEE